MVVCACNGRGSSADAGTTDATTDSTGATTDATGSSSAEAREICDGSSGLRFAMLMRGEENVAGGEEVVDQNGAAFLHVDGTCRFWAKPIGLYEETRTGTLEEEQAGALAETFSYAIWPSLEGRYLNPDAIGATWWIFHDSEIGFGCYAGCPGAPAEVLAAYEAFHPEIGSAWDSGESMTGPLRVLVVPIGYVGEANVGPFIDIAIPWPFKVPPEEVSPWMENDSEPPEGGYLETDEEVVTTLREARAGKDYDYPCCLAVGPVEDRYFTLHLRDVLPFEDENGRVPEPEIPPG